VQPKIKCAVIGAGWWATFAHIPALLSHPNAELVAIQTNDRDDAKRIAADFAVPHAYTDTTELIAQEDLQAVVISSSPHLHYRDALVALKAGKHVLIEKPMTLTLADSIELTKVARSKGTQFLISCPWHYTPHALEARRLMSEGAVGQVRMISLLMTNSLNDLLRGRSTEPTHGTPYMLPRNGTYSDPNIAGGGQIYTQVSHAAAYLAFLTGAEPAEVFARFHNDGEVLDIYDTLNIKMNNGAIVSMASTGAVSTGRRDYEVRVFGTKGSLFLGLWRGTLEFVPLHGDPQVYPALSKDEIYPHSAPAHNLIDSILDPSVNKAPATFGVAAMQVIEAACQSAATGANVFVQPVQEEGQ
jgi:predicted dehydrogenase